jgi:hypothetical protein
MKSSELTMSMCASTADYNRQMVELLKEENNNLTLIAYCLVESAKSDINVFRSLNEMGPLKGSLTNTVESSEKFLAEAIKGLGLIDGESKL